jgi:hypothetical protein
LNPQTRGCFHCQSTIKNQQSKIQANPPPT